MERLDPGHVAAENLQWSVVPAQLRLGHTHEFNVTVDAKDEYEAQILVEAKYVPDALSLLGTLHDAPYLAELMEIAELRGGQPRKEATSGWRPVPFRLGTPQPLGKQEAELLRARSARRNSDRHALRASRYIYEASQLRILAQVAPLLVTEALMRLYLAMELLVNSVNEARESLSTTDSAEAKVVDDLTRQLNSHRDKKKKTSAIKVARQRLAELEQNSFPARIEFACTWLDISGIADGLKAFNRFRNKSLGHAGEPLNPRDVAAWLQEDAAPALVRRLLCAYLDRPQV